VVQYYDRVMIIFIHDEGVYGTTEKIGAFASTVKYSKGGIDYETLLENEEFAIIDEIVFEHIEEKN